MPFLPKVEQALGHYRVAQGADRMPHALLVSGHPRGLGTAFAQGVLGLLFPGTSEAQRRQHVDIRWLEPEGKARFIKAEVVRDLIDFIGLTAYEGGWKAGVVLFADRMNETAQNILLKTLEEPPPKSLLLLVTDTPAGLLPTIRSRTQWVDVLADERSAEAPWLAAVIDLMRHPPARRACEMIAWTDRLTAPLRSLEGLAEEEETARQEAQAQARGVGEFTNADKAVVEGRVATRVKEMREEIFRVIQLWQRDVLARALGAESVPVHYPGEEAYIDEQAQGLSSADALARVAAVDEVRELLEHNIRDTSVLPRLARALSKPVA